ncbi:unnamed protein product, partial [Rotaria sordida]
MASVEEYSKHSNANNNISNILRNELEKKISTIPNQYRIPTDVLEIVDVSVEGQWKERLIQARNGHIGEHIELIPCYVACSHWIGVIIKFRTNAQVELAQFLDPVMKSDFDPSSFQKIFAQVYPGSIVRAGHCEKHHDRSQKVDHSRLETESSFLSEVSSEGNESRFFHPEETTDCELEVYSITKENLQNLYNDSNEALLSDDTIVVPDRIETEIEKELQCLKKRLDEEKLQSPTLHSWIESSFMDVKKGEWKRARMTLRRILKQICPLDIQEMLRLVDKVVTASETVKDKNVVLFLGETGSGKSTTIHFLAGSKMKKTKMEGLNHIAPDLSSIRDPNLRDIASTPFAESVTRYIMPVTVNFEDVGAYTSGSIVLCDSPGFEDTGGPEVDIANGIGIVRAIKSCKSVKPVILISYMSIGDRYDGLKKLARILVGLIPGIADHMNAFSYFFTKYPPDEIGQIHASLEGVRRRMNDEDKSDAGLISLFNDMLRKTRKGIIVIDPIDGKPADILDDLAASASITHPDEVFEFYITEKSKGIVHEQVEKHKDNIMSATVRFDYSFINYKLDQLKKLSELLELDYIQQTYNDCVRFVSKHLEKEYKEATDVLERCLLNQQVLNDEVIKQLNAYIEHADLAETLRDAHLRKELVSSSAFIHYIDERVDSLLDDLKQNDIDDISVKSDLNTLALLSNAFPRSISSKYDYIREVFERKVKSVVDSFKESVSRRNFDESANEMTRLSKSQTVLQGHLDSNYIVHTLAQLKDDFLQYLKESIEKLDDLFNQEQLDKSDINRLNDCVILLESAKNTFTLHVHIPLEMINQIQKEFLSKILNYFNQIIQKMNAQLETSNPFDKLKSSLKLADNIRTITIIEINTSQSYFQTLEKICGCIRESKRTVEEILKAFHRDERGIDYVQLIEHISRLKSVEWFQEYRSEIYLDVLKNIEQQIVHHVEALKRSLLGVTLDLNNSSKLEHVSKTVIEISAMKPIEKIFEDIGKIIDEVNTWFQNSINTVFTMIKDTFSFDSNRRTEELTYDINKLDKAFIYLDICKGISILRSNDWMPVLNTLEEFIRHFYRSVQEEMENVFESIQQYPNETKEITMRKARILSNRLQEMSELKKEHNRIFSHLSNQKLVAEWEKKLRDYLLDLSDEMSSLHAIQQTQALINKLFVAKALSACDSFLTGDKYIDLYRQYQSIFFTQNQDVCKKVIQAIKNNDYEEVASEIVSLQASNEVGEHFYKQVKRALNLGLDNLITETKSQAITLRNEIEIEEIRPLVDNLRRLKRAKQFVSSHLDEQSQIDETIKEVEKMIEEKFERFLRNAAALIDTSNFYEADRKIAAIRTARTLLGQHCTSHVCQLLENLIERQNKAVSDLVDKYSELDISDYTLYPPTDIFEKFVQVNATNPIYDQSLRRIKEQIVAKFREELKQAKLRIPPDPDNPLIRKIESGLKYLPEMMKNALEQELTYCKEDIRQIIRDHDSKLNNAVNTRDLTTIRNILEEYNKSEGMQAFTNKSRKLVFEQMQEIKSEIMKNLTEYHIREALINVKKLDDYQITLGELVIESRKNRINERIDEFLTWYKSFRDDAKVFAKLGALLNQDKTGIGQSIIAEHKAFQGFSLSLFNEKTKRHDIEYILKYIEGDSIDTKRLKKRFDEFDKIYRGLIEQYLHPNLKLDRLISDTILIVGKMKQTATEITWNANVRSEVPKLMAHIFALWTLTHSEHYFEAQGLTEKDNYLLQPHAAQVISIFRMLGIGDTEEELKNNLVQIGTGEGKSVTLAVTAIVLALLGFDVNCACYSEYLSQRDYNAFLTLFDSLGVSSYIHYGTFKKLCEDKINENGNIREVIENLISTNTNNSVLTDATQKRAKILLIDEVDVFFSREFYGNLYTPAASLRDSTIISLTNYIWTN